MCESRCLYLKWPCKVRYSKVKKIAYEIGTTEQVTAGLGLGLGLCLCLGLGLGLYLCPGVPVPVASVGLWGYAGMVSR